MTAFPVGPLTLRPREVRGAGPAVWRVLAVIAPVLATAVTVWVAWNAWHPSFPFDEIDQLQMSRMLAGLEVPTVRGAGYYPLWSLLIAPLWWITADPFVFYAGAIAIGAVVGLVTIVPFTCLARRFRLTTPQAVVAASIVVTLPSVTIQADYALSERLLLLTVALSVLTAWRLWEKPTALRAVLFAVAVASTYFTHVRMLAVVAAAAVWIVLFALRNWRVALVGAVTLGVATIAVRYGGIHLNVMLLGQFTQGENIMDTLRDSRPGLLLRSALGQAWSQIIGSFGLVVVGFVAIVRWAWQELRRLRAGRATFVLAIVLAMFALTTIKWASDYHLYTRPWHRLDTWLYSRYVDPLTVVLVLVAVAIIVRGIRRAVVVWSAGISLAVMIPTVYWVALEAPTWGYTTPAHIPGAMVWWWALPDERFADGARIVPTLWNENRFWLYASIAVLIVLAVVFVARRWTAAVAAFLAVVLSAASLSADHASDAFRDLEGTPGAAVVDVRTALTGLDGATVAFDNGCNGDGSRSAVSLNYFGYWLLPTIVQSFNSSKEAIPAADVLITCIDGSAAEDATLVPGTGYLDHAIWVRPGTVADALAADGLLP